MSGASREPGWYPDRNDPEFNRYWNGRAWTARRHPAGAPPPPLPLPLPATEGVRTASPASVVSPPLTVPAKKRLPVWLWIVGSLMIARSVLGVVAAFDHSGAGSTSTVTTHPSAVSSPAATH